MWDDFRAPEMVTGHVAILLPLQELTGTSQFYGNHFPVRSVAVLKLQNEIMEFVYISVTFII